MKSRWTWLGFGLFLVSGGLWTYGFDPETDGMAGMMALVRKRFPEVPQLATGKLAEWLADAGREAPLLLDVRREEEYAVSHLPRAVRVEPDAAAADLQPILATGRPVVVYCSVGYRSSALARRLLRAGATNVFNLEGSIFQWAAEDRPLEDREGPATKVHPYNRHYGVLLPPEKRAAVPAAESGGQNPEAQ